LKTDKTKEQTTAVPEGQDPPPKEYHHWWFIGIFAAMALIAGLIYLLANRDGEESTDENLYGTVTDYGLKDSVPVSIENFHQLTVPSQVSLIDELIIAITQNGTTDHTLYQKLIIAYANNDQDDMAFATFQEFETLATSIEKDFGFYADGTRWALDAGNGQKARQYYEQAINYDADNQDPDYLTQVGFFKQEMIERGLVDE